MRGGDQDRETEATETALPEVAAELMSEVVVLPWRGTRERHRGGRSLLMDLLERA